MPCPALLHALGLAGALGCASVSPAQAEGYQAVVHAAKTEGVPVKLAVAVAAVESGGRCHMTGSAGERGQMQVKPATARSVGIHGDLYDCHTGALAGVRYLKQALSRSGGSWPVAATRYNAGLASHAKNSRYASLVMAKVR